MHGDHLNTGDERVRMMVDANRPRLPVHHAAGSGVDAQHPELRAVGETEFENVLAHVAELYVTGMSAASIASELNLARTSIIDVFLVELRHRWAQSAQAEYDERMALEVAKLDRLEREYWAGWQRSLTVRTTQKQIGKLKANERTPTGYEAVQEQLTGDPRFLDGLQKCMERRHKLLGLEAETKIRLLPAAGPEQQHVLDQRIAQYEAQFGLRVVFHPADADALTAGYRVVEPVGAERSASAAERVLDVADGQNGDGA